MVYWVLRVLLFLQYRCKCREGHWRGDGGGWVVGSALAQAEGQLACAPCEPGGGAACIPELLRAALLAANLAGMLLCLVIALIIFKKRKCKVRTFR